QVGQRSDLAPAAHPPGVHGGTVGRPRDPVVLVVGQRRADERSAVAAATSDGRVPTQLGLRGLPFLLDRQPGHHLAVGTVGEDSHHRSQREPPHGDLEVRHGGTTRDRTVLLLRVVVRQRDIGAFVHSDLTIGEFQPPRLDVVHGMCTADRVGEYLGFPRRPLVLAHTRNHSWFRTSCHGAEIPRTQGRTAFGKRLSPTWWAGDRRPTDRRLPSLWWSRTRIRLLWVTISVFLVDDHEIVRRGLTDLLEAEPDMRIVGEAASAGEALARIPGTGADVAVLDVRLPDGNGVELCRELLSTVPGLRCLMLTSYADDEALFNAIMAGASGFVLKQVL